jgi:hypothetical protein
VTDKAPIDLKESTGYERAEIQIVDLTRFASVNDFAKNFNDREDRLDILVQNAGVLPEKESTATEDGWETTQVLLSFCRSSNSTADSTPLSDSMQTPSQPRCPIASGHSLTPQDD